MIRIRMLGAEQGKCRSLLILGLLLVAASVPASAQESPAQEPSAQESPALEFRVLSWNIWHGGKEDGPEVGPRRVVEVIRESGADLVAMQETYGSGEQIAQALQFRFQPRGTNVSIHSRFPILEDVSVFEEFKCVGAVVELPNGQPVAFYSIWLPYKFEIWKEGTRPPDDVNVWLEACEPSASDLRTIQAQIQERLTKAGRADIPVIVAGDFNSMSHLDYTAVATSEFDQIVDWPTSQQMIQAGFRDSYRETNPLVDRQRDRTWSPRFPGQQQDRIDFIYYRGARLRATESRVIDRHAESFPSDHAAVLTTFAWPPEPPPAGPLRILSYNIKHCRGMDNQVELPRTAAALVRSEADVIALQEVDLDCRRSGQVNQPRELGRRLGMHAAFGRFMDFQGGRYGMAILSRFPMDEVRELRLPEGNEPRVALAATVRLPDDQQLLVVNVHFDWVADDAFRFAQAKTVQAFLESQELPYVLLGDFNDTPESRTLALFRGSLIEARKPESDRFTFSSVKPEMEIDFIFAGPRSRWQAAAATVGDEPVASDHRPVSSELRLLPVETSRQPQGNIR